MHNILNLFFNTVESVWSKLGKLSLCIGQNVQNLELVHTPVSVGHGYTQAGRRLSAVLMNSFFSFLTSVVEGLCTYSTRSTKTTNLIYKRMY